MFFLPLLSGLAGFVSGPTVAAGLGKAALSVAAIETAKAAGAAALKVSAAQMAGAAGTAAVLAIHQAQRAEQRQRELLLEMQRQEREIRSLQAQIQSQRADSPERTGLQRQEAEAWRRYDELDAEYRAVSAEAEELRRNCASA